MGVPAPSPSDAGHERLPRGVGNVAENPEGFSIEFARLDDEGTTPTLAVAVAFAGLALYGAWKSDVSLAVAVPFAAAVAWVVHGVMRRRHRRYRLEASAGGLVTCQVHGEVAQLHLEQALSAAASVRRRGAFLARFLPGPGRE